MSVYVIGHKSPDTDSVTAAIAYAELMKAKGEDYIPVMSGKLNPETEVVLKQFGFSAPEIMTDATGAAYIRIEAGTGLRRAAGGETTRGEGPPDAAPALKGRPASAPVGRGFRLR